MGCQLMQQQIKLLWNISIFRSVNVNPWSLSSRAKLPFRKNQDSKVGMITGTSHGRGSHRGTETTGYRSLVPYLLRDTLTWPLCTWPHWHAWTWTPSFLCPEFKGLGGGSCHWTLQFVNVKRRGGRPAPHQSISVKSARCEGVAGGHRLIHWSNCQMIAWSSLWLETAWI